MFRDRRAFWLGTGAVIAGVVLHLPMFLGLRDAALLGAVPVALAVPAVELRKALEAR